MKLIKYHDDYISADAINVFEYEEGFVRMQTRDDTYTIANVSKEKFEEFMFALCANDWTCVDVHKELGTV